ncbi:hypothetical protein TRIUR3_25793 [Triticum urartu]|uniref:AB hydrolase-1 domain-containing protein n=2 Tax=Triticum TaxID=4564 RepID=A0A9R0RZQ3_TRITD|nr:hypothetical protein TRIUR3_25793 [Triticum urartu]VAH68864.1 unnamed protein product [Triticum turgidum subsp. durum]
MVNLVEAQKPLLHFLIKWAGLRQHTVDVDGAGTVLTFWVPKDKVPGNNSTVAPEEKQSETSKSQGVRRPSVVLVHGFAAEGIVTWQFQVGALAKHYDVYIPDLLYFGGSTSSAELLLPESVKGLKALLSIAAHRRLWFPERLHRDFLEVMFTNRKERAELLEGLVVSNKDATVPVLPQKILLLWGHNDNIFNIELAKTMKEQLGEKTMLQSIDKAGHLVHLERPCVYNQRLMEFLAYATAEACKEPAN